MEFVVIQFLSLVQLFSTPSTAAHQAPLSSTLSLSLLKLMSIETVMLSTHLISAAPFSFYLQAYPASVNYSKTTLIKIN